MDAANGKVMIEPANCKTIRSINQATKRSQNPAYAIGRGAGTCQLTSAVGAYVGGATEIGAAIGGAPEAAVGCPHTLQNAAPSGTFAPHFEQYTVPPQSRTRERSVNRLLRIVLNPKAAGQHANDCASAA